MNYPGVYRQEIDDSLTSTIDNSTYVATVGRAVKGIANAKVLLNTEGQLIDTFGYPVISGSYPIIKSVDYGIYSALEALKETSNVWYVRLTDGTEKYSNVELSGTTSASAISANISATPSSAYPNMGGIYAWGNSSEAIYDIQNATAPAGLRFTSIGPGSYGNNYAVGVFTTACSAVASLSGTVDWTTMYDNANASAPKYPTIFKVCVYTKTVNDTFNASWWTSVSGTPVETFYCSTDITMVDNFGNSLFIEDVINGKSAFVYAKTANVNGTVPPYTLSALGLTNGADSTALTTPLDASGVWSFFENKEKSPLDVAVIVPRSTTLVGTTYTNTNEIVAVDALISKRMDLIALVQASSFTATTYTAIANENTTIQTNIATNQSYFAKYVGWNMVYDRYNASRVYLPNVIYAGAIMARTDRVSSKWEAPAGIDRGIIAGGKQNVDITPKDGGKLYDLNLNVIKFINGVGNVIWGQKTAQLKATARNRLNVRRCLIHIENNVEDILNTFIFRGNTSKERERASSMVNSFMQTVLAGGGVQSYKVVCDSSNNTKDTISNNILNVDIYVQPTYTIEFVKMNTIISSDSVNVSEV